MNLVIKVTAGDAAAQVKTVTTEAAKAETGVAKVGTTGTKALADVAGAAAKAGKATKEFGDTLAKTAATFAADAFGKLNQAFQREADIIERIRGPMREYRADMDALERLYKKGTLSVVEYNDELERLIKTQGTMHGPVQAAAAGMEHPVPKSIGVGDAIEGAVKGGEILNLAHQLDEIVGHANEVEDVFIRVTNAARKFEDASHGVNVIISEQIALAHDLNSGLTSTMDVYDAVRDGTDELNLSHNEQLRLTKSLGEAVQISGKSLEQAAGLMSKFSYALASGRIESRELKGIMREVPDIASLWTTHFGLARRELILMVDQGKIGTKDLMRAMMDDTAALDANFAKRSKTNEQRKEEWLMNEKLYSQQLGVSLGVGHVAASWDEMLSGSGRRWTAFFTDFNESLAHLNGMFASVGTAIDKEVGGAMARVISGTSDMVTKFGDGIRVMAKSAGLMSDPWGDGKKTGFLAQFAMQQQIKGPEGEAKIQLENLNGLLEKGALSAKEYNKKYKELMTTINGGELPEVIRLWESIQAPQKAFHEGTHALDSLMRSGLITIAQYNVELTKLIGAYTSADFAKLLKFKPQEIKPNSEANAWAQHDADVGHERVVDEKMAAIEKQYKVPDQGDLGADLAALDKRTEILRMQGVAIGGLDEAERRHAIELQHQAQIIEQINGPQETYRSQLAAAGDLLASGHINAEKYGDAVDRIRAAYLSASDAGKSFTGGMEAAWLKLKDESSEFGKTLANTLVGDVDKLNESLVAMANGGEVSWGRMVDSMIQDLEKLILKQLEVQAINGFIGLVGAGASGGGVTPGVDAPITSPSQVGYGVPSVLSRPTAAGATPAAVVNVTNVTVFDPSAIHQAMDTPGGHQVIRNVLKANPAAIRPRGGS